MQVVTTAPTKRFGHTCHLVGSKQLIILGGHLDYGAPNSLAEFCAGSSGRLNLLDLTSLQWADTYIIPDPEYKVPRAIVDWIGGRCVMLSHTERR